MIVDQIRLIVVEPTAVLDGFRVAKPVSHDGSSDRSSSGLKESKQKVDKVDKEDTKRVTDSLKVEPNGNVNQEQAETRSKESNGQNVGRIKGIPQLSVDDISSSIGRHENGVHLRQDKGRVVGFILQRTLDSRVTLSREMGHEVSSKGDEKCPSKDPKRNAQSRM